MQEAKRPGRPKKEDAKTTAETSKDYRDSLKRQNKKPINVYLSSQAKGMLDRVCQAKNMTKAEAIAWALEEALAYNAIKASNEPSMIHGQFQKALREKLRDARLAACFSTEEMADRLDVAFNRYEKWESGLEKIPEKYLAAVIAMLQLPSNFFRDKIVTKP